ncbi:MAG TPA: DUF1697 domain-containing protein [Polyangiales bacterium]|nr:DUF1697 domain-containing protein [Polyangiales bacterium]
MKRYAAFLRGVSPMNCKMAELKRALERAGYDDVKTLLSSGNVVFSAPATREDKLQRALEAAMQKHLGRTFQTFVRSVDALREMLEADPYAKLELDPKAKRVVTFLQEKPKSKIKLPAPLHDARILKLDGREAFSVYVSGPQGPVFMTLIEKTFGKDVTTRTWDTVKKVAR